MSSYYKNYFSFGGVPLFNLKMKKKKKLWLVFQKRKVKLATLMNLNPKSSWKKEHLMRPLKRFEQGLSSPKHFVHVIFNLKSKCI